MSAQVYSDGTLVESWDDATRTYTDHRTGESRPYTEAENAEADARAEQESRLDDHEARLRRIEAAVFPAPPDPEDPEDPTVPTWADLGGIWPNGGLLRDGGTVWRNVSGVPLTTPPSGFPGDPEGWTHLFVAVTEPDPDPQTPEGYVGPWSEDATYEVGDVVDKDGHYWRCLLAHGPEQQGTWAPGPETPTIWTDLGPTTSPGGS